MASLQWAMTPGHLDIIAKGKMISDGNPLKQCSSARLTSSRGDAGKVGGDAYRAM